MDVEFIDISLLKEYKNNAKKHSEEQINLLAFSIKEYGFDQPIVVNKNYEIIKGHGRYLAAKKLNLPKVPVIIRDDLTQQEEKKIRILDNLLYENSWDVVSLAQEVVDLKYQGIPVEQTGFSEADLKIFESLVKDTQKPDFSETAFINSDYLYGAGGYTGDVFEDFETNQISEQEIFQKYNFIMPYTGCKENILVLLKLKDFGLLSKTKVFYLNFGYQDYEENLKYNEYIANYFGIEFLKLDNNYSSFKKYIYTKGFPVPQNLWCCKIFKIMPLLNYALKENSIVILSNIQNNSFKLRKFGVFLENSVIYFAPLSNISGEELQKILRKNKVKLNPLYEKGFTIACPLCPVLSRKQYKYYFETNLNGFVDWILLFTESRFNVNYRDNYFLSMFNKIFKGE